MNPHFLSFKHDYRYFYPQKKALFVNGLATQAFLSKIPQKYTRKVVVAATSQTQNCFSRSKRFLKATKNLIISNNNKNIKKNFRKAIPSLIRVLKTAKSAHSIKFLNSKHTQFTKVMNFIATDSQYCLFNQLKVFKDLRVLHIADVLMDCKYNINFSNLLSKHYFLNLKEAYLSIQTEGTLVQQINFNKAISKRILNSKKLEFFVFKGDRETNKGDEPIQEQCKKSFFNSNTHFKNLEQVTNGSFANMDKFLDSANDIKSMRIKSFYFSSSFEKQEDEQDLQHQFSILPALKNLRSLSFPLLKLSKIQLQENDTFGNLKELYLPSKVKTKTLYLICKVFPNLEKLQVLFGENIKISQFPPNLKELSIQVKRRFHENSESSPLGLQNSISELKQLECLIIDSPFGGTEFWNDQFNVSQLKQLSIYILGMLTIEQFTAIIDKLKVCSGLQKLSLNFRFKKKFEKQSFNSLHELLCNCSSSLEVFKIRLSVQGGTPYMEDLYKVLQELRDAKNLKTFKLALSSTFFNAEHGEGYGPILNISFDALSDLIKKLPDGLSSLSLNLESATVPARDLFYLITNISKKAKLETLKLTVPEQDEPLKLSSNEIEIIQQGILRVYQLQRLRKLLFDGQIFVESFAGIQAQVYQRMLKMQSLQRSCFGIKSIGNGYWLDEFSSATKIEKIIE